LASLCAMTEALSNLNGSVKKKKEEGEENAI
jgi:hypothetical protein